MSEEKPARVIPTGYFARRKREESVRKEIKPKKISCVQNRASLSTNLYDRDGRMLRDKDTGAPVILTVDGQARIVRFVKYSPDVHPLTGKVSKREDDETPTGHVSNREKDETNKANRNVMGAVYRMLTHLFGRNKSAAVALVPVDDNDNFIIIGKGSSVLLFLKEATMEGLIEDVGFLENYRVGVIGQGCAPAEACERRAYKDTLRESRQPKAMKDLQRRASHTRDDDELALLCRCTTCGANVKDHDDSTCPHPAFVADTKAIGASDKAEAKNHRPSPAVRKNRRENTKAAVAGGITPDAAAAGVPVHGILPHQERPDDFCPTCKRPPYNCVCR